MTNPFKLDRPDYRRRRADFITAAVMQELNELFEASAQFDLQRAVRDRLWTMFDRNGFSIITDEDRAAMGMETRDDLGWTPSERIQEQQQLQFHRQNLTSIGMTNEQIKAFYWERT
jgi:hypothetical protein